MNLNPIIITTVIAAAGFILSVFAASWLNLRFIERILDQQMRTFDAKLDAIRAEFGTVRAEISGLRAQVGAIENRLDKIDRQLEAIFKPVLPKS